jgi:hypothetical protein
LHGGPKQADPQGADANVPGALRLRGHLDEGALGGALQLVCARHDALRTRFAFRPDGTVLQAVASPDQASLALRVEDAAMLPAGSFVPRSSM